LQGCHRDAKLFGEGSRKSASDTNFYAELAHVLMAQHTAATDPAAEHGVARNAKAQPLLVFTSPNGDNRTHPFVTQTHREMSIPVVQVRHVTLKEFNVCSAHSNTLHLNNGEAGVGNRGLLIGNF
jgi:hypothetical protein